MAQKQTLTLHTTDKGTKNYKVEQKQKQINKHLSLCTGFTIGLEFLEFNACNVSISAKRNIKLFQIKTDRYVCINLFHKGTASIS